MKLLLHLFFVGIAISAVAQTVEVSNEYKMPPKTTKFRIIGKNNDGIVMRLYGSQDVINVFDDNFRLSGSRILDFKNESGLLQYIMLNKNGAVIFYLSQDKKYSVLLAQPVSSKFIEMGKPVIIDTIFDRRDLISVNLRFKQSADQSYLMVYYPFFSGSTIRAVKFIGIDQSLHSLYNKTIPINRDEKELEESRSFVDNNGNSFLVLKPESKLDGAAYNIYRVSSSGDFSTYSIHSDKAFFGEASFDIDNKNGNLVLCALYNDNKRVEEVANGFIYASYNPVDGKLISASYTPFSKQFISELTGRADNNDKGKLYTFVIRKVVLRNDGGAMVIAESYIRDTREVPIAMGFQQGLTNYQTSTIFQFNDIIAFSFNAKAEIDWHSVMRKKQSSEDDNGVYSSFLAMNEKDKMRLFYLDDISASGLLNEYVLTSDGKSDRNVVLNQEEKEVMLLPKLGKQISPNQVVIPSYINANLRLVKITF